MKREEEGDDGLEESSYLKLLAAPDKIIAISRASGDFQDSLSKSHPETYC